MWRARMRVRPCSSVEARGGKSATTELPQHELETLRHLVGAGDVGGRADQGADREVGQPLHAELDVAGQGAATDEHGNHVGEQAEQQAHDRLLVPVLQEPHHDVGREPRRHQADGGRPDPERDAGDRRQRTGQRGVQDPSGPRTPSSHRLAAASTRPAATNRAGRTSSDSVTRASRPPDGVTVGLLTPRTRGPGGRRVPRSPVHGRARSSRRPGGSRGCGTTSAAR